MKLLHLFLFLGLLAGPGLLLRTQAQAVPGFDRALLYGQPVPGATGNTLFTDCVVDAQGNSYVLGTFAGSVAFGSLSTPAASGGVPNGGFLARLDANGTWSWFELLPESADFRALVLDGQGNVYVTGSFADLLVLGPGRLTTTRQNGNANRDVFVAKLDGATRQWQWAVQGGGSGADLGHGIALSPDGALYAAGTYNSPTASFGPTTLTATPNPQNIYQVCFLSRLDPQTGAWQWTVRAGRENNGFTGLAADISGAYLSGVFRQSTPFGPLTVRNNLSNPGYDVFIAKAQAMDGTWLWASSTECPETNLNGVYAGQVSSIGLVTDGRWVYMSGTLQAETCRIGATTLTNRGGITVTGTSSNQYRSLNTDAFMARLSATTGAWGWAVHGGNQGIDLSKGLTLSPGGRVYAAGTGFFAPATDPAATGNVFVTELDTATGTPRWVLNAGGTGLYGTWAFSKHMPVRLRADGQGRLHLALQEQNPPMTFAPLSGSFPVGPYVARLSGGPLAVATRAQAGAWQVYPNPLGRAQTLTVAGLRGGQPVQVFDVLGREVARGTVRLGGGLLRLTLPTEGAAGVYIVRAGAQGRRLVVE